MALAYPSEPTTIRVVYVDNHARVSTKDYPVPVAVWDPATDLLAALVTIRDALVTQINLNTKALVLNAFISIKQTDDTLTVPAADCHVNEVASLVTVLDGGENKKTTIQIPAPVDAMFVGSSGKNLDIVDVEDTNLNTFLDLFQATGGSHTVSDGEYLDDATFPAVSGRRIFRKTGARG
jgi:hypothetical protein